MANYQTLFCTELSDLTSEERDWWQCANDVLRDAWFEGVAAPGEFINPDTNEPFNVELELEGDSTVYLASTGDSSIDDTARLAQLFLRAYRPSSSIVISWASTCSRSLPDSFTGGCLEVTAKGIEGADASVLFDQLKALKARHQKRKPRPPKRRAKPATRRGRR
jgi:hypothetical protein